ncbi:MAG: ArsR/SmtB family transcription factor [Desulfobulbus sp.]
MKTFLHITKALSDPNRVRVIKLLEDRSLCVCEIREVLGLAQPTVSSHMKILEDAGLVTKERQGTWMIYSQAMENDSPYVGIMLGQLRGWLNDDPELQAMIAALPAAACLKVATLKA